MLTEFPVLSTLTEEWGAEKLYGYPTVGESGLRSRPEVKYKRAKNGTSEKLS